MDFAGKVALVTGGAGGIGRAACLGFAGRGARVAVVDRDQAGGEETVQAIRDSGGTALFVEADVSKSADVRNYVDVTLAELGAIDCFFSNAGIEGKIALTADCDEDVFDAVIAVNLKSMFLGLKYVIPGMLSRRRGSIVLTSSTAGLAGYPGLCGYSASKHGVIALTRTAASEYGHAGIRVNAVCPGPTDTRMLRSLEIQANGRSDETVRKQYVASVPTGRVVTAEEVANLVLFLSSEGASSMTGAHYLVDGGRLASPTSLRDPGPT